jgi:hypothetical protein
VQCSAGACSASCEGNTHPELTDCNQACSCDPC